MAKKRIIWQDFDINVEDYRDFLEEEHPEVSDEAEQWQLCAELNDEYLEDERANLNIAVPSGIIAICDIGRWNGRFTGFYRRELGNIAECLNARCDSMSYNRFFVDGYGNLRQDEAHHDATNHYLYRAWKSETTDDQKELLKDALYEGAPDKKIKTLITRYTRSLGPDIAKVYGWAA